MKEFTNEELIALGKQSQEARSLGGQATLKKYGAEHFSKLGKLSAAKKQKAKNEANLSK